MTSPNIAWIVDDGAHPTPAEYVNKTLTSIMAGYEVSCFTTPEAAIESLDRNPTVPKIMFFDALRERKEKQGNYIIGDRKTGGYTDYEHIVGELKKRGITTFPDYVVFISADLDYAKCCKELADKLPAVSPERIFTFHRDKILQAGYLLDKNKSFRKSRAVYELNAFFNLAVGTNLPADETALDRYRIENGILEPDDAVRYHMEKKISAGQTLDFINRDKWKAYNKSYGEFSERWEQVKSYGDDEKIAFEDGAGTSCHGYAVFTMEQAQLLRRQDKPPVLIVEHFQPEWYSQLQELAGLVITNGKDTGHIRMLAEAYKIPILVAASEPQAIRIMLGKDVLFAEEIEIRCGNPVTVDCNFYNLFKGHISLVSCEFQHYVRAIPEIYHEAMVELGKPAMKFKANINSLSQANDAFCVADGIGLVRTEHLAFTDSQQFEALRQIFTGSTGTENVIRTFAEHQYKQLSGMFKDLQRRKGLSNSPDDFPVRVRLLDAPPEEFLSTTEIEALKSTIASENQRGVQMGLQKPALYREQLKAIFHAYAESLTVAKRFSSSPPVKLEIMVPMVKTLDELMVVKEMAAKAAKEFSIQPEDYRFGIMVETIEAARNIKTLAPHVEFISFGSNDFTQAVLGISRSDYQARKAYHDHLGNGDPFITMHKDVADVIICTAYEAREANSAIEIDLCGAHAANLASLKALRPAQLTSISLSPSDRNHCALRADWALYDSRQWKKDLSFN